MNSKRFTSIVLVAALFSSSCGFEEAFAPNLNIKGESGITYIESKSSWQKLKKERGNSYEYSLEVSSFTGHGSRTTMVVENGKVISRHYLAFFIDPDTGEVQELESYSETGEALGTNSNGAVPMTMDDLYKTCASEYLSVDEETYSIFFNTNGEGILSLCGYVENGCMDDCFTGISISNFVWR